MGLGGAGNGRHTHTHTYTHTVPRDTQGGWSPVKTSDEILTHVGLALPLIQLMGCENQEDAVGVGEQELAHTHAHTHT